MPIIKKTDIYEGGKAFADLQKEIDSLTVSLKGLIDATRAVSKEGTGSEAKERVKLTQDLTTATNKLAVAEHDQLVEIQKAKIALAQKNSVAKDAAKEELKLTGEYDKQSKKLNELRKQYKNLILEEGKATRETVKLKNEITKLDTKLKQVDSSVGQNQRSVGKYTDALKGLGSQLIGALGIGSAITLVISGFKALAERAKELIVVTNKVKQIFDVTTGQAKKLSSQILALSKNFDEDYTEILKAANAISKELGISAKKSLDLIQQGFQKGSNNNGEFLDILKEYPVQFKKAGLSAEEPSACNVGTASREMRTAGA